MYSKQEAANLKREFWTVFGQYMRPVVSADGEIVNWVNYKTGEKHIFFKTSADNKSASVAIELHHPDKGLRSLYFEQFLQLKNCLKVQLVHPGRGMQNQRMNMANQSRGFIIK